MITTQIKKRKTLIAFDDLIADMLNDKKLETIVTELFIRSRKLNTSIVFYLKKIVRLNSTHFFIIKVLNVREPQQIVFNHSSDTRFDNFMKFYKICTNEPYSLLVNHTTF